MRVKYPLEKQVSINNSWSMDFMNDGMIGNRRFRTFNVMDDCCREVLAIEIDTSLSAKRIIRVLDRVVESRGKPARVRVDNGSEFTSGEFCLWCREHNIEIQYIQPGKLMQSGYIERFNRLYREAVLDAYLFFDLNQVRQLTAHWIDEYNSRRPYEAQNNLTPEEWKKITLERDKLQKNAVC
ncbi:transposase InsO family protein [Chitinophaga terrae (ex Kim and Jung 2007)]|nr:transposase InsO family protein [Chitinophaga terrae (ex Kim and Jung 2007)]